MRLLRVDRDTNGSRDATRLKFPTHFHMRPSTTNIRPSVGLFYIASAALAALFFKEPLNPAKKEDVSYSLHTGAAYPRHNTSVMT